MLPTSSVQPFVKALTAPSFRRITQHFLAPPIRACLLARVRCSLARAHRSKSQCCGVHQKALHQKGCSEQKQGSKPSDSSAEQDENDDSGSTAQGLYLLAILLFILGSSSRRHKREKQEKEASVGLNGEVDREGARD